MIEQLVLETEGFHFSFDVEGADQEYMGMVVTLQLLPPLQELTLHSESTTIAIADLRRFLDYFEQHLAKLKETDGDAEAIVFLNWELGFKVQALSGDIDEDDPTNSSFMINCQVNVAKSESGSRVYMGAEGGVSFEQTRAFMRDIQTLLDQVPQ